jgi:parallel beta-helix repeat protein
MLCAAAGVGVTPALAQSRTLYVVPGQPIQAALDRAEPGDTIRLAPGIYQQQVTISVADVTLEGAGPRTVISPPPGMPPTPCAGTRLPVGICVARPDLTPLGGVRITALKVDDAHGIGVLLAGASGARVDHVVALNDGEEGIDALGSTGTLIDHDSASGNAAAGIAIAGQPDPVPGPPTAPIADAVVYGNDLTGNARGIYIRDASDGIVADNYIHGNCGGILILRLSAATAFWNVSDNLVIGNSQPSPATPPVSGVGIAITGASNVLVRDNAVIGNLPTGPSLVSGGIVVISFHGPDGTSVAPNDNEVVHNRLWDNAPAEIVTDNTGVGNVFAGNR